MIMDNTTIFPCPRNHGFPTGLRVLVVDDDLTWLKILEKMLKKCLYEVTTCCLARDALSILRERKDGFDIVISDVNMPDMDGFKLLELVGLEMDLPVIMMSVDGETSRVMKGVQHGACDYLLKPIRMKELRNIWQHVLRKRINDVQNYDDVVQMLKIGSDHQTVCEINGLRKRKEVAENKQICSTEYLSDSFAKRSRVVWTVDLHQKFVKAVKLIGIEKIGPKKILDSMNVPWLTRENVASHLQKYRLYLSRLQKQNGDKPFEVANHLDVDFCTLNHSDLFTNDESKETFSETRERRNDKRMNADIRASTSNNSHYNNDITQVKDTTTKSRTDCSEPELKKIRHSQLVEINSQVTDLDFNILQKYSWNEDISIEDYFENDQRMNNGFNHWEPETVIPTVIRNDKNMFEAEDSELALVAFGKDYKAAKWDQSYYSLNNFHEGDEADLMASVPVNLFDALRYEWCGEPPSCNVMMDQSLSISDSAHFSSSYYPVR